MIDARRERKIMTTEHDRQDAHEQHVQRPRFATNTAHDTHEEVRAKLWGCKAWGRVDRVYRHEPWGSGQVVKMESELGSFI